MMTSSNGNIFRVTGTLWGESQRQVTRSLGGFFDFVPEQTAGQTIETLVIGEAIALIMTSL